MDIKRLKQFSIFKGLSEEEINHFKVVMKEVSYPVGKEFIREGDVGDSIFLLLNGSVEINQALTLPVSKGSSIDTREKAITRLSAEINPLFGEMSLFKEEDKRTASVVTLTECDLIKIMKNDIFKINDQYPEMGYKVMQNFCRILCTNLVRANTNVLKLTTAFSLALER